MSERLVVPVVITPMARPASRNRPPMKVSRRVRMEPASPPEPERAMRKNEARETSSQPMNSRATSSARTSRRTASMKEVMST